MFLDAEDDIRHDAESYLVVARALLVFVARVVDLDLVASVACFQVLFPIPDRSGGTLDRRHQRAVPVEMRSRCHVTRRVDAEDEALGRTRGNVLDEHLEDVVVCRGAHAVVGHSVVLLPLRAVQVRDGRRGHRTVVLELIDVTLGDVHGVSGMLIIQVLPLTDAVVGDRAVHVGVGDAPRMMIEAHTVPELMGSGDSASTVVEIRTATARAVLGEVIEVLENRDVDLFDHPRNTVHTMCDHLGSSTRCDPGLPAHLRPTVLRRRVGVGLVALVGEVDVERTPTGPLPPVVDFLHEVHEQDRARIDSGVDVADVEIDRVCPVDCDDLVIPCRDTRPAQVRQEERER